MENSFSILEEIVKKHVEDGHTAPLTPGGDGDPKCGESDASLGTPTTTGNRAGEFVSFSKIVEPEAGVSGSMPFNKLFCLRVASFDRGVAQYALSYAKRFERDMPTLRARQFAFEKSKKVGSNVAPLNYVFESAYFDREDGQGVPTPFTVGPFGPSYIQKSMYVNSTHYAWSVPELLKYAREYIDQHGVELLTALTEVLGWRPPGCIGSVWRRLFAVLDDWRSEPELSFLVSTYDVARAMHLAREGASVRAVFNRLIAANTFHSSAMFTPALIPGFIREDHTAGHRVFLTNRDRGERSSLFMFPTVPHSDNTFYIWFPDDIGASMSDLYLIANDYAVGAPELAGKPFCVVWNSHRTWDVPHFEVSVLSIDFYLAVQGGQVRCSYQIMRIYHSLITLIRRLLTAYVKGQFEWRAFNVWTLSWPRAEYHKILSHYKSVASTSEHKRLSHAMTVLDMILYDMSLPLFIVDDLLNVCGDDITDQSVWDAIWRTDMFEQMMGMPAADFFAKHRFGRVVVSLRVYSMLSDEQKQQVICHGDQTILDW